MKNEELREKLKSLVDTICNYVSDYETKNITAKQCSDKVDVRINSIMDLISEQTAEKDNEIKRLNGLVREYWNGIQDQITLRENEIARKNKLQQENSELKKDVALWDKFTEYLKRNAKESDGILFTVHACGYFMLSRNGCGNFLSKKYEKDLKTAVKTAIETDEGWTNYSK